MIGKVCTEFTVGEITALLSSVIIEGNYTMVRIAHSFILPFIFFIITGH